MEPASSLPPREKPLALRGLLALHATSRDVELASASLRSQFDVDRLREREHSSSFRVANASTAARFAWRTRNRQLCRTGSLRDIGVHNLGFARYRYWQCVDCSTDYPQLPGNAGPSCNGCQISLCPYCRPRRVLP